MTTQNVQTTGKATGTGTGLPVPSSIPDIFYGRVRASRGETAILHKKAGRWQPMTWGAIEHEVRTLARALADWVAPKDNVCLLSENRVEWWIADLATLSLGAVSAPIYATNPPKDIAYILEDAGAKLLFVSTRDQLEKVRVLKEEGRAPGLERVVVFDEVDAPEPWVMSLSEVKKRNEDEPDPVEARLADVSANDLATLIYTSGTTGEPKGVMLSHMNIVSNVLGAEPLLEQWDVPEKLMLSFLPLSHSFERTAGYYVPIHYGFKVAFAESIDKLVANMGEVRPTGLVSVPRIYEKLYARVMESAQHGVKKALVSWALDVGKRHAAYRIEGKSVPALLEAQYAVATRLVFSKLHTTLGGRLKYAISGGAPLAKEIAEFLFATGLTVFEGYGLSETSPVLTANILGGIRLGSVGRVWPGVEIKIVPEPDRTRDGEILARGPNIMMGYYNKPEATKEVLDEDGWFHTGDIGYLDDDGFLFITDRKKELIKTAGGKYVAPQPIENALKVSALVEQAVVVGDKRKFCVALVVPSFEALQGRLGREIPRDREALNRDREVRSLIQREIDGVNADLGSWEQIKRFHLLERELSQDTGELTPTLKLKRRIIDEKYEDAIDAMYPED